MIFYNFCCCSAVKSCPTFCDPVDCSMPGSSVLHHLLGVHSNSCSSRWWCHPAISSSVIPFSCLQAFLSSGSFPVSESSLSIMWPKYCSFSFNIILPLTIQNWFKMDWLDFLAVQGTLKSLPQHHSSKASILWRLAFFMVRLSHPYRAIGKTTPLTIQTLLAKWCLCFLIHCLGLSLL